MRLLAVIAVLLLPALPARALFHLWDVAEVFSDASETVQFIELQTPFGSQQFLETHALSTRQGATVLQTFVFPADLPGNTTNKTFLMATPGFAAVAGIEPDYEIPAGFIEVGVADAVNFADVDLFPLAGLPTDGVSSLLDGGGTAAATPRNFAGQQGTIDLPEPAAGGAIALLALSALRARGARGEG